MFELEKQSLGPDLQPRKNNRIVLASASPRRRDLLQPFFRLEIIPAETDESLRSGENPRTYVRRVSCEKWTKVARQMKRPKVVVAADTVVILCEKILGKPRDVHEAKNMLRQLSGKRHRVTTAVSVGWSSAKKPKCVLVSADVEFRALSARELSDYLKSGEWRGKAGSYAIQEKALKFTSRVVGSLTAIVGLPLSETLSLVEQSFSHPPH